MEITESVLSNEIDAVLSNGETDTNFSWEIILHLNDTDVYNPIKVLGLTISRNYITGFTDEITCKILVPLGKYARQIYPNRDKLQATLIKKKKGEVIGSPEDENTDIKLDKYTAILLNQDKSITEGQGRESTDEDTLDLITVVEVDLQLINKSIEQIRTIQVGGVYSKVILDQLILSLLTNTSTKANVDGTQAIKNVDVLPISNKSTISQLVIPHGTLLIDIPNYLQNRVGVYNSGLGSYIQNKIWYVYYLYDTSKFHDREETTTIIVLPQNKYSNIDRSYLIDNDTSTILVTGDTSFVDDNGTNFINKGNGARITDAGNLINSSSKTENNKTVIARGKNNSEFVTQKKAINFAPSTSSKISSNPFATYSEINSRNGGLFKAVWQSADPDLLRPGASAKIMFDDQGEIKEYDAILLSAIYISVPLGGITGDRYNNQGILTFFVKKNTTA
jgi:hypothetical protein